MAATIVTTSTAPVRGALWAIDLDRIAPLEPRRGDYVLTETHSRVAELAAAIEVTAAVVRQRLDRGCRAFVARSRDDVIASWLWVSTDREWAAPIRQDLHFASDECHGWNAGTLPEHRCRGLCTALLRYACREMTAEGRRLMWNGILDENLPSRRAHVAAGFRPVLRLTAVHMPPAPLRARPADYADPELVARARRMLAGDSQLELVASGSLAGEGRT